MTSLRILFVPYRLCNNIRLLCDVGDEGSVIVLLYGGSRHSRRKLLKGQNLEINLLLWLSQSAIRGLTYRLYTRVVQRVNNGGTRNTVYCSLLCGYVMSVS